MSAAVNPASLVACATAQSGKSAVADVSYAGGRGPQRICGAARGFDDEQRSCRDEDNSFYRGSVLLGVLTLSGEPDCGVR